MWTFAYIDSAVLLWKMRLSRNRDQWIKPTQTATNRFAYVKTGSFHHVKSSLMTVIFWASCRTFERRVARDKYYQSEKGQNTLNGIWSEQSQLLLPSKRKINFDQSKCHANGSFCTNYNRKKVRYMCNSLKWESVEQSAFTQYFLKVFSLISFKTYLNLIQGHSWI